jgi:hypothetical protein
LPPNRTREAASITGDNGILEFVDYFSSDYREARGKFRDACAAAGCPATAHRNPAPGPDGGELFTDVARFGADGATRVLFLVSGTHGVEGFCGSGCQVGWIESGRHRKLPAHLAVVLVHAINPFGFAWLRRVTEDNVDLNRNFVDHDAPYPESLGYDRLHQALAPTDWSEAARAEAEGAIATFIEENGAAAYQAALSGGQYGHADGLFFGGNASTWSNRTTAAILEAHTVSAERVAMVDFHTGLGPLGYGELICFHEAGGEARGRALAWFGESIRSPLDGTSVSAVVVGHTNAAYVDLLPRAEVTALALEFGTYPLERVERALRAENWLHHHGDRESALGAEIRAEFRKVFYPDSDDWKELVWLRAQMVTRQAVAGLAAD